MSDWARSSRCESEKVEDHKLHREWYEISAEAARAINRAKAGKRRVVAVGTTTVRTLEYAAGRAEVGENRVEAGRGEADAFIYPGYRFRIVDALLTNFHLPQSTLLMLVCALGGQGIRDGGLPARGRSRISVLLLWRLHVRGVMVRRW